MLISLLYPNHTKPTYSDQVWLVGLERSSMERNGDNGNNGKRHTYWIILENQEKYWKGTTKLEEPNITQYHITSHQKSQIGINNTRKFMTSIGTKDGTKRRQETERILTRPRPNHSRPKIQAMPRSIRDPSLLQCYGLLQQR